MFSNYTLFIDACWKMVELRCLLATLNPHPYQLCRVARAYKDHRPDKSKIIWLRNRRCEVSGGESQQGLGRVERDGHFLVVTARHKPFCLLLLSSA